MKFASTPYQRVVGSFAWSNTRPGVAVVVGEEHIEDKGVGYKHLHVLDEIESDDVLSFYDECVKKQIEYSPVCWVYGCWSQIAETFRRQNTKNAKKSRPQLNLYPMDEKNDTNQVEVFVNLIRQRVKPDRKSLHFAKSSFLPQRIMGMTSDDLINHKLSDYPELAAIGFIISYLDSMEMAAARPVRSVSAKGWT